MSAIFHDPSATKLLNAGYYFANGALQVFRESARWISQASGLKTLVARPLDLAPQWAAMGVISISPALYRICADMNRVKIVIGAAEAIYRFETNVIGAPKEKRTYWVIKDEKKEVAGINLSIEQQMLMKIGMVASWIFSTLDLVMYLRNSTILSLGLKGLTRLSWIATVSGTVAAVQGLYTESQFLYRAAVDKRHTLLHRNAQNKVEMTSPVEAQLAWDEAVGSMIKVALHVSALVLAAGFAASLLGYASKALNTMKVMSLSSMTLFAIVDRYWDRLVLHPRQPTPIA